MGKHRIGERTCMGCGTKAHKAELFRFVLQEKGEVLFDLKQNKPGRGVYLCPKRSCFTLAGKKRKKAVRLRRVNNIDSSALIHVVSDRLSRERGDGDGRAGEKVPSVGGQNYQRTDRRAEPHSKADEKRMKSYMAFFSGGSSEWPK